MTNGDYIVEDKIRELRLDDGDYAGVRARFGSMKVRDFTQMIELSELAELDADTPEDAKAIGGAFATLVELLAKGLRSWNLKNPDGTPIPATFDGLMGQEFELVMELVALRMSVGGTSAPLGFGSSDGAPPVAPSMPMVEL